MRPISSKENPTIKVKPIYCRHLPGEHRQGAHRAQERHAAGSSSVLLSTDMFTLIDEDAIVPIDDFVKTRRRQEVARRASTRRFMQNSQTGGKTWGIPFQRSTIVLYWNKELFKEAGLDPEKAPGDLGRDASRSRRS